MADIQLVVEDRPDKMEWSLKNLYLKSDPQLEVLVKTCYVTLPGLMMAAWWIITRRHCEISQLISPGFVALCAFDSDKWRDKLKVMFFTAGFIALFQFLITITFQESFLLLMVCFFMTWIIFAIPFNRSASASAVGMGALVLSGGHGYHLGMNRVYALGVGLLFAIVSVILISIIFGRLRIRYSISAYAESLLKEFDAVLAFDSTAGKTSSINSLNAAHCANRACIRFRYALYSDNLYALRAQRRLFRLYGISRGISLLRHAKQHELEMRREYLMQLRNELENIVKSEREKCTYKEIAKYPGKPENNYVDIGIRIIYLEIKRLSG